ncbi:fimbrial protein [Pseudomonas deceptionensis]|uniref:Pilin (Type 1 fimbria component protein) n=1 Tax=Pseudomonas deceptionensis TaxID=882211 RepID=A0A1H5P8Z6_PSEDM|nr:fimbrial protein [Pseudomonas deceptionensis]SEF10383.1 Pilin (type 1 fimbria component protein) [Pseudomonas deceptionensis]
MNTITYRAPRKFYCPAKTAKKIIMTLVVMGGSFFSYAALASCTVEGAIDRLMDNTDSWIVQVDGSAPVGSFLALIKLNGSLTDTIITCDATGSELEINSDYPLVFTTPDYNVYESGIPGIGMGFYISTNLFSGKAPHLFTTLSDTYTIESFISNEIALFKTGEILTGGKILPTHIAMRGTIRNHDYTNFLNITLAQPITVTILRPTCVANTPILNVNLGEVNISDFNQSGRTTPQNFSIDLNCTGGSGTRDVHVTLTDANSPANASTQLNLSPNSGAQGIALEVHNKFGAVSFGPDLSGTGNPGQWLDGAAGVGSYSIPLSVNYVRLPGPIKGGTANSGVTYTLNYD